MRWAVSHFASRLSAPFFSRSICHHIEGITSVSVNFLWVVCGNFLDGRIPAPVHTVGCNPMNNLCEVGFFNTTVEYGHWVSVRAEVLQPMPAYLRPGGGC